MKIGYFPGCALEASSLEFDLSTRKVMDSLGVELVELPDWNCCGATSAHDTNHLLSIALPARNLAIAQREGLKEILAPCAACFSRLLFAQHQLSSDRGVKEKVSRIIEMPLNEGAQIFNLLSLLSLHGIDKMKEKVTNRLEGLKVACYYGCLLVRTPKELRSDDVENPRLMDDIVQALGCETLDWPFKTECCGASFSLARTEVVLRLSSQILQEAHNRGADLVAVACPLCHANLDLRQPKMRKAMGIDFSMPILFITQLIGLAFGMKPKELGLDKHFVKATDIMAQKRA